MGVHGNDLILVATAEIFVQTEGVINIFSSHFGPCGDSDYIQCAVWRHFTFFAFYHFKSYSGEKIDFPPKCHSLSNSGE